MTMPRFRRRTVFVAVLTTAVGCSDPSLDPDNGYGVGGYGFGGYGR